MEGSWLGLGPLQLEASLNFYPQYLWYRKQPCRARLSSTTGLQCHGAQGQLLLEVPVGHLLSSVRAGGLSFLLRVSNPLRGFVFECSSAEELHQWTTTLSKHLWPSLLTLLPREMWGSITCHLNVASWKSARLACSSLRALVAREDARIRDLVVNAVWPDLTRMNVWKERCVVKCVFEKESAQSTLHPLFKGLHCSEVAVHHKSPDFSKPHLIDATTFSEDSSFPNLGTSSFVLPAVADGFQNVRVEVDTNEPEVYSPFKLTIHNDNVDAKMSWWMVKETLWDNLVAEATKHAGDSLLAVPFGWERKWGVVVNEIHRKDRTWETFVPACFLPGRYKLVVALSCRTLTLQMVVHLSSALDLVVRPHRTWKSVQIESVVARGNVFEITFQHCEDLVSLLQLTLRANSVNGQTSAVATMESLVRLDSTHSLLRMQYHGHQPVTFVISGYLLGGEVPFCSVVYPEPTDEREEKTE